MTATVKAQRRAALLANRRAVPEAVRDAEAEQLCAHLPEVLDGARVVCAYVPVGAEPGSAAMVERLHELCETVLLPVAGVGPSGEHLPLRWGRYVPGSLVAGRFGLQEPPAPWLPPEDIRHAEVVLVPALAVDRFGVRLGRGGGFYDRSLRLCPTGTRMVAVVRDCELVDELPHEPHDVRMTHALTPAAGCVRLGEWDGGDGGSST